MTERDNAERSILHYAVMFGNFELAKAFVDMGADIELKDKYERTPLHYIPFGKILKVVLERFGQGFHTEGDVDEIKSFVQKVIERNKEVLKVKDRFGRTPLHYACICEKAEIIELMLYDNLNEKDEDGYTPLHLACENGNISAVEILLSHGSDTEIENDFGKTPLQIAQEKGYTDIVRTIQSYTKRRNSEFASSERI